MLCLKFKLPLNEVSYLSLFCIFFRRQRGSIMGQPFLMQRWDTVQGGLPVAPGLEGKGRNTTIALVSSQGRRSLAGGTQKQMQRTPESLQPGPASCTSEFRSQAVGWGVGSCSPCLPDPEDGARPPVWMEWAAVCGLQDTFTCSNLSPVSGGLSPINSNP